MVDKIDQWLESDQGAVFKGLAVSAVLLAETVIVGDKKGHERKVWALRWMYDQVDKIRNLPDWVDWIAKYLVIPFVPSAAEALFGDSVQQAFDQLDGLGLIND